ncbi:MAG: SAM-dependent chlorinase/fluorinase, partial [Elusimicrobia bacterium]|nr:SAM-dependent chlorinase/fluorinase [Elusimicrobiota bacterium]
MAAVIALLTDFGLQDPYVGVMKGVIADLAPRAKVVDLCHGLPPQDVRGAALFLRQSAPYFPKATLFVVVVDPGVGSDRRVLYARTRRHSFLAPDNGALSWLPDPVLEWRSVVRRSLFLAQVSSTFHGRDLFAPVAARLSRGLPPSRLG